MGGGGLSPPHLNAVGCSVALRTACSVFTVKGAESGIGFFALHSKIVAAQGEGKE